MKRRYKLIDATPDYFLFEDVSLGATYPRPVVKYLMPRWRWDMMRAGIYPGGTTWA